MGTCLTDQDLTAYVSGSATPEQLKAWMSHIAKCDACSQKVASQDGEAPERLTPAGSSTTASGIAAGTHLGDFEIKKRIGAGGMGVVYKARQISPNRHGALKVLPPGLGMTSSAVVRFHREAQAAAKLHHTNIVAVYAEGEHEGTCFYAMELIEGQGLDEIVAGLRDPKAPVVIGLTRRATTR